MIRQLSRTLKRFEIASELRLSTLSFLNFDQCALEILPLESELVDSHFIPLGFSREGSIPGLSRDFLLVARQFETSLANGEGIVLIIGVTWELPPLELAT